MPIFIIGGDNMGNDEFISPWKSRELNHLIDKALAIKKELEKYFLIYHSLSFEEKSKKEHECFELLRIFNYEPIRGFVHPYAFIDHYHIDKWEIESVGSNYSLKVFLKQMGESDHLMQAHDISPDLYKSLQELKTYQTQKYESALQKLKYADTYLESLIVTLSALLGESTNYSKETGEYHKPINDEPFKHSPDYRTLSLHGTVYALSPQEAQVIEILNTAHEEELKYVTLSHLIQEVAPDTSSKKLRDIFRDREAREALIKEGPRKGTYCINL